MSGIPRPGSPVVASHKRIRHRDGAQISAHTASAAEHDPFTRLHRAAAMYAAALTASAEHTASAATMARIDAAARAIRADITETPPGRCCGETSPR